MIWSEHISWHLHEIIELEESSVNGSPSRLASTFESRIQGDKKKLY